VACLRWPGLRAGHLFVGERADFMPLNGEIVSCLCLEANAGKRIFVSNERRHDLGARREDTEAARRSVNRLEIE